MGSRLLQALTKSSLLGNDHFVRSSLYSMDLDETPSLLANYTTGFLACEASRHQDVVALGSRSGTVCVLNCASEEQMFQTRISAHPVRSVCWTTETQISAGTSEGMVVVVDTVQGLVLRSVDVSDGVLVRSVFCPRNDASGNVVAWSSLDGHFGILDTRTQDGTVLTNKTRPHRIGKMRLSPVSSVVMSQDKVTLITSGSTDGTVKLWDVRSLTAKQPVDVICRVNEAKLKGQGIVSLDLDDSDGRLLVARRGGSVEVYSMLRSPEQDTLSIVDGACRHFAVGSHLLETGNSRARFRPAGDVIALSGNQGCMAFDLQSPEEAVNLHLSGSESIGGCDWLNDGSLVATSTDGSVYRWKTSFRGFRTKARRHAGDPFFIQELQYVKRSRTI